MMCTLPASGLHVGCVWFVYDVYVIVCWLYMVCLLFRYGLYVFCNGFVPDVYVICMWFVYGLYMDCTLCDLYMVCVCV